VSPALSDQLLPVVGATRHARDMLTEACALWDLPELVGPGSLIVNELVANGVEHAATVLTLRISRMYRHLLLAVHDGSPEPPRPHRLPPASALRGRGLLLVEAVASRWGWLPCEGGKVVWAILPADPR
jgi:two-component sensor histidine kinase